MEYIKLFFVFLGKCLVYKNRAFVYIQQLLYAGYISRLVRVTLPSRFLCDRPISIVNGQYINIHSGRIKEHCRLEAIVADKKMKPKIQIGKDFFLGGFSHIGIASNLRIGSNFLTGSNCLITDHTHGFDTIEEADVPPIKRQLKVKGPITIGDNVFLGDNVVVLGSVCIGSNVTIGASTVVTKDIPADSIAFGNPMRIIPKKHSANRVF